MCRNFELLFHFEPLTTEEEIRASALQSACCTSARVDDTSPARAPSRPPAPDAPMPARVTG